MIYTVKLIGIKMKINDSAFNPTKNTSQNAKILKNASNNLSNYVFSRNYLRNFVKLMTKIN